MIFQEENWKIKKQYYSTSRYQVINLGKTWEPEPSICLLVSSAGTIVKI